jgi:hypothetical protein
MAIIRFDENGKYVNLYHTITEASKNTKQDICNIHKCINGKIDKINGNYFIRVGIPTSAAIEKISNLISKYVTIKNSKMANLIADSYLTKNKLLEKIESSSV